MPRSLAHLAICNHMPVALAICCCRALAKVGLLHTITDLLPRMTLTLFSELTRSMAASAMCCNSPSPPDPLWARSSTYWSMVMDGSFGIHLSWMLCNVLYMANLHILLANRQPCKMELAMSTGRLHKLSTVSKLGQR